jgi:hypothetical protein
MPLLVILLILIFGFGGHFYNDGAYRGPGFGISGILIIVLILLLLHII